MASSTDLEVVRERGRAQNIVPSSRTSPWPHLSRQSEIAYTFWSWRTLAFLSRPMNYSARDLLFVLATLLAFAVTFLAISVLLKNTTHRYPVLKKTHAILKQSVTLEGIVVVADGVEVRAFLGVPYAQPSGRFQKSHLVVEAQASVIDATRTAAACPQNSSLNIADMSEDCLNLNIWAPYSHCQGTVAGCNNKTVLFFLHGGFFQVGSNSDHTYDGRFLSAVGNLVVVVPNYRLGVFGFLSYNNTYAPGNVGLFDQLQALAWVRENIAEIGGDLSNIVLVGHESGAASVGYHLYTARENLGVKRAVLLSGSPFARYPDDSYASLRLVKKLATILSCPTDEGQVLACLKRLPASTLTYTASIYFFPTRPFLVPPTAGANATQVEDMDILLGFVGNEGGQLAHHYLRYLTSTYVNIEAHVMQATSRVLRRLGFERRAASLIAELYMSGFGGSREFWVEDLLADILVVCPVQYYAEHLASMGNRVYLYFAFRQNASRSNDIQHRYVTDHLFGLRILRYHPQDGLGLSLELIRFFADFVNGVGITLPKKILSTGTSIVVEGSGQTSVLGFRKKQCDYLKPYYLYIPFRYQ